MPRTVLMICLLLCSAVASVCGSGTTVVPESDLTLWYRQPAADWLEALPVGNGRLGAMVFGGVSEEQIQLNEETIWSGGGPRPVPTGADKRLPEIRQLLFDGKYGEAEALVRSVLLSGPRGDRFSYQTLGSLILTTEPGATPSDYRRSLDLDTGIAVTTFKVDGVTWRREVLSSFPDQILIVRISADSPGKVNLSARLERPSVLIGEAGSNTLIMEGQAVDEGQKGGVRFAAALRAVPEGGAVEAKDGSLVVTRANAVTLLFAAGSDYNLKNPAAPLGRDNRARVLAGLAAAAKRSYAQLRRRSVEDHQRLFRRVGLELVADPGATTADG